MHTKRSLLPRLLWCGKQFQVPILRVTMPSFGRRIICLHLPIALVLQYLQFPLSIPQKMRVYQARTARKLINPGGVDFNWNPLVDRTLHQGVCPSTSLVVILIRVGMFEATNKDIPVVSTRLTYPGGLGGLAQEK